LWATTWSTCRGAFAPHYPELYKGVDPDGAAVISQWWTVIFFDGSLEQQETQLNWFSFSVAFNENIYFLSGVSAEELMIACTTEMPYSQFGMSNPSRFFAASRR